MSPPPQRLTVRAGVGKAGVSVRYDPRVLALAGLAAASGLVLGVWSLTLGDFPVAVGDVFATLVGQGPEGAQFVVAGLRLPRVLTAAGVGAALAVSGALFQSLLGNPLVAPDVIGIEVGASAAAVFVIVVGAPAVLVPAAALAGAVGTTIALYALA